jgi:hypothetical protein
MAEIIYLVGPFHLIAVILNGYDVAVPAMTMSMRPLTSTIQTAQSNKKERTIIIGWFVSPWPPTVTH